MRHTFAAQPIAVVITLALCASPAAFACTNFLITKGASTDGSTMITYSADSHTFYGDLVFYPAAVHKAGALRDVHDWETGKHIGKIKEAPQTYRVVGNINEHQVAVAETTYGGREELENPDEGIDYGSLMYIALQRAKTAREAIGVMGDLVAEYGYRSSGESFSFADPHEVWIMDMIGMGKGRKGAVWVARRVPDGYVSAHANQARIREFPLDDPENCLYSKNVISFAREKGYFSGADEDFSFVDAYAPADFGALRFCEARVWAMFRRVSPSVSFPITYVKGHKRAAPLPLWIRPDSKVSVGDVMDLMRDHFEGSELDLSKGIGAGPYSCPYRWRPLTWKLGGVQYFNERATSTQQTGFSFVTQSRGWLPDPIGGIIWFGVDDTASTVYVPMYAGITKTPHNFATGTGSFTEFTWDSAFWVFNWVANFSYSRYSDMSGDIRVVQKQLENGFLREQINVEAEAHKQYRASPAQASELLTAYSSKVAEETHARWRDLGQELLLKYLDGNVRDENGKVTHPGYPEEWYRRIVKESRGQFKMRKVAPTPIKAPRKARAVKGKAPAKR